MTLVDTDAAAASARVHPETIRTWAHRGAIMRRGTGPRRRALYDLDEVMAYAAEMGHVPADQDPRHAE